MASATSGEMADLEPSRLQKLPGELRSRIYELAMPEFSKRPELYDYVPKLFEAEVKQPPLTRTCKQFRNECLQYFYSNLWVFVDPFAFRCPRSNKCREMMCKWLVAIGVENRSRLAHMYIPSDDIKEADDLVDRCARFHGRVEFVLISTEERLECTRVWGWSKYSSNFGRIKFH
ncbi:hypothetical protein LTR37_000953 [Vermiconidia calcicola]|uniref:Uncharacterized protein n=1 Tax=Vermiconidia calcicola TaxID=1690605 RepID=A0ACC3NX92_9PEZI|nr:hypothetical protein LTR37_000953 [Vermiconidia calcicola]